MPEYSIEHIGKSLGAKLLGNTSITIEKLSADSRSIFETRKLLFFAIRGKNHDGHIYIPSLIEKGVKAFVVSDQNYCTNTEHVSYIIVDDVVKALQDIAAMHRGSLNIPVVAITG
ncbi:MAG TPA: Mur ligase domain-containing protein, partial [Bacteroidales bacterium]|nr:Mur ligase domain-containing protein [Bacteroidales bacterium]